jgi:hypothetical protein
VTSPQRSGRGAVPWLTAQSVMFGAMAALLGIVANAMFLDAYGSAWLPATYIAIGFAGIVVSGAIARTAERFDLLGIALSVLGAAAAGLAVAWAVAARGDAPWVSVPLLVLFPILIQLGFVFIGGQAGRILDIAGIKASFPRIMAGFPVGAVLGGLLGGPLVTLFGRTEHLLFVTALAQAAFAALLWATGRRFAAQLASPRSGSRSAVGAGAAARPGAPAAAGADEQPSRPSLRTLLASRFVALILAYQVLSALGSQLADFLVYDRATAQYPDPVDLTQYLAAYTAVMNAVSIGFLFALAGPLLRRFGLRLGIAANPLVLTVFALGMIAVNALTGGTSLALLAIVSAGRIADIALTDGTTRTSINATYQVLPERARLSVQTAVEGIGVPVAIGISGVLILGLNALPSALVATIVLTTIVCAIWTWVGFRLYREYGPALVDALQRRPLLLPAADLGMKPEDEATALRLVSSHDARAMRLGLDLLAATASPTLAAELAGFAGDPRPEIRLSALAALATSGDEPARRRLAEDVLASAASTSAAVRLAAARALEALDGPVRAEFASFLEDDDATVRSAALDAVQAGDTFAVAPAIAALEDARSAGAAAGAIGRLGDAVVPSMAELLDAAGSPVPLLVLRLVRATTTKSAARDEILRRHVGHRDRELGLLVTERLVAPEPALEATAVALDNVMPEDVAHAGRIMAALAALEAGAADALDTDEPLRRALTDELELVRLKVIAGRIARHGSARLGPVMVELGAGGQKGALAAEALEVLLSAVESRLVLPLLQPDLAAAERLRRLQASARESRREIPTDVVSWLQDVVADADDKWASAWLRACALYAARGRGVLDRLDVAAARSLGDPIVDEVLGSAGEH